MLLRMSAAGLQLTGTRPPHCAVGVYLSHEIVTLPKLGVYSSVSSKQIAMRVRALSCSYPAVITVTHFSRLFPPLDHRHAPSAAV